MASSIYNASRCVECEYPLSIDDYLIPVYKAGFGTGGHYDDYEREVRHVGFAHTYHYKNEEGD